MGTLKEENEKLKTEIKRLKSSMKILEMQLQGNRLAAKEIQDKCRGLSCELKGQTHKIDPSKSHFTEGKVTALYLDDVEIIFDSPSDKAALLAKAICKSNRLNKLEKKSATVEEIYNWLKFGDDWFDISSSDRKKFEDDLYQWFRRINDKALVRFNGQRAFERINKQYRFNPRILKNVPIGSR